MIDARINGHHGIKRTRLWIAVQLDQNALGHYAVSVRRTKKTFRRCSRKALGQNRKTDRISETDQVEESEAAASHVWPRNL
jgi:hypothetical protein